MPSHHLLCTQCGAETSAPLKVPPGSPWVALALAVPFVVPGVIYSIWRYTMRRTVCPTCGHAALIPADAPLARSWRANGWIPARAAERSAERPFERLIERNLGTPPVTAPDIRIDRIEQAIDAIASEVDRIGQHQRSLAPPRGEYDAPASARLRDRSAVTPT
jgi:rRNA maturation protein Nop10